MSLLKGAAAERRALSYLKKQGLCWITSNYRTRCGEIDLIMRDDDELVFVEVRERASMAFGGAAASVTRAKQQKIIRTALIYLQQHRLMEACAMRFDVVSFDGIPAKINWIKQAFLC